MAHLFIDIETEVVHERNGIPQPSVDDKLKLISWKDHRGEKGIITIDNIYDIQQLIKKYPVIIGFNLKGYDIPILEKNGCSFQYKIILDIYDIIKKHLDKIKALKSLKSLSLDSIATALELKEQKDTTFDYGLLKGDNWKEHLAEISVYALQDIAVTEELFIWLADFFEPFKYGLGELDIARYKHMTVKTSVYAYKVICRKTGIKEEYNDNVGDYKGQFEGGYVAEPEEELIVDDIIEIDIGSAYPHAYMQANLFSNDCKCCKEEEKYDGGHIFTLQGRYCSKQQGIIEKTIKEIYCERLKFKKEKNRIEYALKILLNIIYGICANPRFKNVYNLKRAADCTHIGRETIKYVRARLKLLGYNTLYSDTDSVFVKLNGHTEEELQRDVEAIIKDIKSSVAFPQDTFKMPLDKRIKLMYFPRKMKKNYLYVTKNNELIIKGLKIIKCNNQKVSTVVFNKYIKPKIINELVVKFDGTQIKEWIEAELQNDISLATISVKASNKEYKNENQINNQIYKTYGKGVHDLVPNFKIGVGIGVRLCTPEEFKTAGLDVKDINIQQAYNELQIFTDMPLVCKSMVTVKGRKRMINTLEQWLR